MEENQIQNKKYQISHEEQQDENAKSPTKLEAEEQELEDNEENKAMYLYEWVDSIPLSRQKKNIARDFNDAVLLAEIIKQYCPKLVELHNYPSVSSTKLKLVNWNTLNQKVLKKLGIKVNKQEIIDIVNSKQDAIEKVLAKVYHCFNPNSQVIEFGDENNNNNIDNMDNNYYQEQPFNVNIQVLEQTLLMKDQEINELKEYIENLEKKLNISTENQNNLENKLRELNDFIIQNNIDI